jgi:uncharacterized membrane protein
VLPARYTRVMAEIRRFVVLAAILTLFLLSALFLNLFGIDASSLGLSPAAALLLLGASLTGCVLNVPVYRQGGSSSGRPPVPWIFFRPPILSQNVVALNVGGALIPLAVTIFLLGRAEALPTVIATVAVAALCRLCSQPASSLGVLVPLPVPAVAATTLALLLAPRSPAPVAFVSGVTGTLVAVLLSLPRALKSRTGLISIGGAGA